MSQQVEVDYLLTVNASPSYNEIRKLEMSLIRVMSLIRRFSGNEDINQLIDYIQKAITIARSLQIALRALQAASGPIGWLYAATTVIGTGVMIGESFYDNSRGT
jgi:hypothetical protein